MPKHKPKGPLILLGAAVPKQAYSSDVSLPLRVIHRDSAASGRGLPAHVHHSSIEQLVDSSPSQAQIPSTLFLQLASGSDCVLYARSSDEVPVGCIEVDEVQQANLRLCAGETYKFCVFDLTQQQASTTAAGWQQAAAAAAGGDTGSGDQVMQDAVEASAATDEDEPADASPVELIDLDAEVRLLHSTASRRRSNSSSSSSSSNCFSNEDGSSSEGVVVDAREVTQAFCKQCFGRILAVDEYVVIELPHTPPLLLRVTATNTLTAEEQQEAIGYHCFRGLLTPDTKVYLTASSGAAAAAAVQQPGQQPGQQLPAAAAAATQQQMSQLVLADQPHSRHVQQQQQQQQQQDASSFNGTASRPVQSRVAEAAAGLQLVNAVTRAAAAPATNLVHIYTSDGEWFPVKKKLLRPCIGLTKAVRDSGDTAPEVHVPIDTLTFDRVLIFLEAQALNRNSPGFAIHLLDDLQQAAEHLGLRSLQDYCSHLKGSRQAALGVYSFADVQQANAGGKVWLLLDGMVLDVGRWLPEHPGGATIIPAQSINCDCSRFFEMYHASRESFLYLQEFYIGELVLADRPHVPVGGRQPPSDDFMVQLREYTGFRQPLLQQLEHRIPATHLGAKRV